MTRCDFDTSILQQTAHRPWPMPDRMWVMTQTWHDLLFAHWPVSPRLLRDKVPAPFELDVFEGTAWLGIVPFHMTNVAPRAMPSLPWISEFAELNVRTYVSIAGRPGVYFFSLDAGSTLASQAARRLLNLPYYTATMSVISGDNGIEYRSSRNEDETVAFQAMYRPIGGSSVPFPGTLEYFLTERYCLYHHTRRGAPYRLDIHHPAWQLQPAVADISTNTMGRGLGLGKEPPALLHFARRQDMVAWRPALL
jgi:uncharacterized protein YqjF (DUF2071 family)